MKKRRWIGLALCAALSSGARAGSFVRQASFATSFSTVAAMDTDSLGNLYLLGLPAGATTYQVRSFAMPAFSPLFAFDTSVSSPAAFAVDASGAVDVLDVHGGYTIKRFTNVGQTISSVTFEVGPSTAGWGAFGISSPSLVWTSFKSAAIDKRNGLVYVAYQYMTTWTGCLLYPCSNTVTVDVTRGAVNQYDLAGGELAQMALSGVYGTISGAPYVIGCYTPSLLATDAQGDFYVADAVCGQMMIYSSGTYQTGGFSLSGVPKAVWTDPAGSVYVVEPVCGASGCPYGTAQSSPGGVLEHSIADAPSTGLAVDGRLTYDASGGTLSRWIEDAPPSAAAESGPFGSLLQHSSDVFMSWQASTDPDGDPVSYDVYAGTAPNALALAASGVPAPSTDVFLSFGATYYWQVIARDSYAGVPVLQTSAPVVTFNLNFLNHPPATFAVTAGTGTISTRAGSVELAWSPSIDPDGDPVAYAVLAGTAPARLAVVQTTTATMVFLPVQYETTYYWSVQAFDPFGATTTVAGTTTTVMATFLNNPPDAPQLGLISPIVKTMQGSVEVSWAKVTSPQGDPIAYTALLGDSPVDLAPVASIDQSSVTGVAALRPRGPGAAPATSVSDEGSQVAMTLSGLGYDKSYYLQVQATTIYGAQSQSPLQSFALAAADGFPKAYNYPNPFSPSRGGTNIVFNAPASGYAHAVLTVYSEFGQKLVEHDYGAAPPGVSQVGFDGRDASGRPLMNGSYVARVRFDGPSDRSTFYLLVVK